MLNHMDLSRISSNCFFSDASKTHFYKAVFLFQNIRLINKKNHSFYSIIIKKNQQEALHIATYTK